MSKLSVTIDGNQYVVEVMLTPQCSSECVLTIDGKAVPVIVPDLADPSSELGWIIIDERPYELTFDEDLHWLKGFSRLHRVQIHDQEAKVLRPVSGDGRVEAPITGLTSRAYRYRRGSGSCGTNAVCIRSDENGE